MRVLLLEPDSARADELTQLLRGQNMQVHPVRVLNEAVSLLQQQPYGVIVLEADLQGQDAVEVIHQIRQKQAVPMLVLSDRPDPQWQVQLLDAGADDVLARPVSPEVMLAQIRALLRRCMPGESAVLRYEDLSLDLRSLEVRRGDTRISCTSREIAILEYLMRHPQRVISRAELSEAIWDANLTPDSNVIEVFIARLRRKIDRPFPVALIHTMVGRGYMLSVNPPGKGRQVISGKANSKVAV